MANLNETPEYTPGIYQLETTDDVVGGAEGISNLQAKQLANRTAWLKERAEDAESNIGVLQTQGWKISGFEIGKADIVAGDIGKYMAWATDGGAISRTLPAASAPNVGRTLIIEHYISAPGVPATPNGLTISRSGSNTILYQGISATSLTLDEGDVIILAVSSSTQWTVVSWQKGGGGNMPASAIQAFARNSPPPGWLACSGQTVSRTQYAALFAAIGTTFGAGNGTTTFNLPDLRGEFVRGWDNGRNVDTGRAFGSAQAQAIQAHTHSITQNGNDLISATGSVTNFRAGGDTAASASTGSTGGTETRPRNVAMLYCIKY